MPIDELDRFSITARMRRQVFKLGWTGTAAFLLVFVVLYVDCVSSSKKDSQQNAAEWKEMYKEVVRQQVQPAKQELMEKQASIQQSTDSIRQQMDSLNKVN